MEFINSLKREANVLEEELINIAHFYPGVDFIGAWELAFYQRNMIVKHMEEFAKKQEQAIKGGNTHTMSPKRS